jgi:uncharacterized protein (UPF0335 family)
MLVEQPTVRVYVDGMAKKPEPKPVAHMQPDEINALHSLVVEFIGKVEAVDNEIETLKEDRKELVESYKDRLDVKTLNSALKVIKIQNSVEHKDAYDLFMTALTEPTS